MPNPNYLIEGDARIYYGKYVATASFKSKKVICFGDNPAEVHKEAKDLGYDNPVIFYVQDPDINYYYKKGA